MSNYITAIVLFPFKLVSRIIAAVLGLALMIVGVVLSCTIIGAVVGVPLTLFGFVLMFKGFFYRM